jgi:hypothetical protein
MSVVVVGIVGMVVVVVVMVSFLVCPRRGDDHG